MKRSPFAVQFTALVTLSCVSLSFLSPLSFAQMKQASAVDQNQKFELLARKIEAEYMAVAVEAAQIFLASGGTEADILTAMNGMHRDVRQLRVWADRSMVSGGTGLIGGVVIFLIGAMVGPTDAGYYSIWGGFAVGVSGGVSLSIGAGKETDANAPFKADSQLGIQITQWLTQKSAFFGLSVSELQTARELILNDLKAEAQNSDGRTQGLTLERALTVLSGAGLLSSRRVEAIRLVIASAEKARLLALRNASIKASEAADPYAKLESYESALKGLEVHLGDFLEIGWQGASQSKDMLAVGDVQSLLNRVQRLNTRIALAQSTRN